MATLQDLLGPEDVFQIMGPGGQVDVARTRELLSRPLTNLPLRGGGAVYGPTAPGNLAEVMQFIRARPELTKSPAELQQEVQEGETQREMAMAEAAALGDPRAKARFAARKHREEIESRPLKRVATLAGSLRGLDPDVQAALARQFGINVPGGSRLQRIEDEARVRARVAATEKANAPLGVELASKLYRYNPETKQLEVPDDPDMTVQQAKTKGFRVLSPKLLERMSETTAIRPAFGALKVAVDQANQHNIVSLGLGRWSGGLIGSEAGKLLDIATRDFALQFDRLMGGVRGAASVTLFEAMRQRMPEIVSTPNLRTRSLGILEGILDTLEDNALRVAFGLPLDKAGLKRAEDNARLVLDAADKPMKEQREPEQATVQQVTRVRNLETGEIKHVKGNPSDEMLASKGFERVR